MTFVIHRVTVTPFLHSYLCHDVGQGNANSLQHLQSSVNFTQYDIMPYDIENRIVTIDNCDVTSLYVQA